MKEGTEADLHNVAVVGFSSESIDVRTSATSPDINTVMGNSSFDHSLFWEAGSDRITFCGDESDPADDNDNGFDECAWLASQPGNLVNSDPALPFGIYDAEDPDFVPSFSSTLADGETPPDDGFFVPGADYIGAVAPGESDPWYAGWTAFPVE